MAATFKDYYETLGVPRTATEDEIKQAYRRLARQHHPDLHPQSEKDVHTKKMQDINEAYSVLASKDNRTKYDHLGEHWQEGPMPPPPSSRTGRTAPRGSRSSGQVDSEGFSDFFRDMFGGGGSPFGQQDVAPSTLDIEAELELPLADAVKGVEREFRLSTTGLCPQCQGTGRFNKKICSVCGGVGEIHKDRNVKTRIPAGLQEGSRIRLKGQGNEGPQGSRGDLYLRIHLLPDSRFTIQGSDLETVLPLMPWQAALGAEVNVGTFDGPVRIRIPKETLSGKRLRLAGKGLGSGSSRGDLFVRVEITLPPKISPQAQALYKQLQDEANG
jgi:curved DNA-binding protein